MKEWNLLPDFLKTDEVKPYYVKLKKKEQSLIIKRNFDLFMSSFLIVLLFPVMCGIGIAVAVTSPGEIIFKQTRITAYGKKFLIYKFRTMVKDADKKGSKVTTNGDMRVTKIGKYMRKYRLDELPQLFNILKGEMTFVGTRPEVEMYVKQYTNEMLATLLLPAGVTSRASIEYKEEEKLLSKGKNTDEIYVNQILPEKMKYNLNYLKKYSFFTDLKIILETITAVLK